MLSSQQPNDVRAANNDNRISSAFVSPVSIFDDPNSRTGKNRARVIFTTMPRQRENANISQRASPAVSINSTQRLQNPLIGPKGTFDLQTIFNARLDGFRQVGPITPISPGATLSGYREIGSPNTTQRSGTEESQKLWTEQVDSG